MSHQQHTGRDDTELIRLLHSDPDTAVTHIFEIYYQEVCQHIYRIIPDQQVCQDIAQSIFLEFWQKRSTFNIRTSVGAYLHKMARSRSLNYLRDNKHLMYDDENAVKDEPDNLSSPLDQIIEAELGAVITQAIDQLPARCRAVFALSRYEHMSYKEISEALQISVKTVENQISKALQQLRLTLKEYHRGKHP